MVELIKTNYLVQSIIYMIFTFSISYIFIKDLKKRNITLKQKLNFKNIDFKLLFILVIVTLLSRIVIENIENIFIHDESVIGFDLNYINLIINFLVTCIFAPIFEEIIFRYGIFENFKNKCKPIINIIIVSLIFVLVHLYGIFASILLFINSIIWTYAYHKKDNLVYPITLHLIFNISSFINLFLIFIKQ